MPENKLNVEDVVLDGDNSRAYWQAPLALLISSGSLVVLVAGAAGTASNPIFTGTLLAGSTIGLFLFSRWREFEINGIDALFCAFVATALVSLAINGYQTHKEAALFAISLAAYPACRLIPTGHSLRPFVLITSAIVIAGTIATGFALLEQWNDPHGKPIVFGFFNHAATVFLSSLGFVIIALVVANDLDARSTTPNLRRDIPAARTLCRVASPLHVPCNLDCALGRSNNRQAGTTNLYRHYNRRVCFIDYRRAGYPSSHD
jgi:hypothetical protein